MNEILKTSIECCKAYDEKKLYFNRNIFAFTTENISGYINYFDLKDKSLLTVGSSGDQIINATLFDPKSITLYDIAPESKYYYYLKAAGVISLTKDEFLEFFRYKDYNGVYNPNVFNMKSYNKIKKTLKHLNKNAYLYYEELFNTFSNITIRKALFHPCEYSTDKIEKFNIYLSSNISYDMAATKLKVVKPKFVCRDILDINSSHKYDNIWLSNIATWFDRKDIIDKLASKSYDCLNEEGKLLLSYLYTATTEFIYESHFAPIYDIKTILQKYKEYNIELKEFDGVRYDSDDIEDKKDSVLLLKK